MTKEELAAKLDGNQYGSETRGSEVAARLSGLVIVFGYSDDLMEFRGAIFDERGAGEVYVTPSGLFDDGGCDCDCKYLKAARAEAVPIRGVWGKGGYSWQYETSIPHATFEIFDGGEKYCRGIVFSLADVHPRADPGRAEAE
jgi:hypothetical protein